MPDSASMLRRALDLAPFLLLLTLLVAFAAIDPRIVAPASLRNVLVQATPVLLLALGAFIVLVTGGIDLSAGIAVALCSILIAGGLDAGDPLALALLKGAAGMAALGLLNGCLIGILKVPPFVTTLATMVAVQGAVLAVARKGVLIIKDPILKGIGMGATWGLPRSLLLAGLAALATWALMRFTRFGLRTYAIGSDAAAAELAGVRLARQQVLTYTVAALFTFMSAVLLVSRTVVITPNLGGTDLLLDAIAAAVIGGTSIFGGRGTVQGVVAGAIIVSLLDHALRVLGTDPSSIELYKGAIIITALLADAAMRHARDRLAAAPTS